MRDVGLAEELAQDALVAALETWPPTGVPDNPGAWLMTTAKNRALDRLRQRKLHAERKHERARRARSRRCSTTRSRSVDAALDDDIGDDLLRLVFTACHPVLSTEARVALTLKLLGGLTTDEIARAFLVPEPTIAQRIVRAKRTLAEARVPFEVPRAQPSARSACRRCSRSSTSSSTKATRPPPASTGRGPRCARTRFASGASWPSCATDEPEVHGLVALMEIQASRLAARIGPGGEAVLLLDQNRARWDQLLIRRGLAALARAESQGGALGPYALQAAIAACHARAVAAADTDWPRIAALYDALAALVPSPVVELNRAVAVAMAFGPAAGLALVDALAGDKSLESYHLLPSVRGDFLAKLGRNDEAAAEFKRAADLTRNERERALLLGRAAACANGTKQ